MGRCAQKALKVTDPEISLDGNSVDKHETNNSEPAWYETPRWGGKVPAITAHRARAIHAKRAFDAFRKTHPLRRLMTGEEFILRASPGGDLVGRLDWRDVGSALTVSVALACRGARRHLLLMLAAAMRFGGYLGVAATHEELAQVAHLSPRQTRRVVAELVELELVLPPVPLFVRYGAASSQRGNAYRVGPAVYAAVDAARIRDAREQRVARTMAVHRPKPEMASHPDTYSGDLKNSGLDQETLPQNGWPCGQLVVSAAPTVDFSAAVPDVAAGELGLEARQGESCSAPPEAPEAVGLDERNAWMAQLRAGGLA